MFEILLIATYSALILRGKRYLTKKAISIHGYFFYCSFMVFTPLFVLLPRARSEIMVTANQFVGYAFIVGVLFTVTAWVVVHYESKLRKH